MQSQVNLQDPFSYSISYIVVFIILLLVFVAIFVSLVILKTIKKKKPIKQVVNTPIDVNTIKNKYILELNSLEKQFDSNKVTNRNAYILLSGTIRNFIYEVTNIKVQNYTLREVDRLNIPVLTELMNEYYKPEFDYDDEGNLKNSINKTREVIKKWN